VEQLTAYLAWMEDLDLNPANLKYVFRRPGGSYRINGLSFRRVDPLMQPMACMALIRKSWTVVSDSKVSRPSSVAMCDDKIVFGQKFGSQLFVWKAGPIFPPWCGRLIYPRPANFDLKRKAASRTKTSMFPAGCAAVLRVATKKENDHV